MVWTYYSSSNGNGGLHTWISYELEDAEEKAFDTGEKFILIYSFIVIEFPKKELALDDDPIET